MKYAKKMRLVECDDNESEKTTHQQKYVYNLSEETFTKPSTFLDLDSTMRSILSREDITDNEKWLHYNQALQRYLFFIKQKHGLPPIPLSTEENDGEATTEDLHPKSQNVAIQNLFRGLLRNPPLRKKKLL